MGSSDLNGTDGSIFNSQYKDKNVWVYKMTITAKADDKGVAIGTTPLFDKDGNVKIADAGKDITLRSSSSDGHKVKLDAKNYAVSSLQQLYNNATGK